MLILIGRSDPYALNGPCPPPRWRIFASTRRPPPSHRTPGRRLKHLGNPRPRDEFTSRARQINEGNLSVAGRLVRDITKQVDEYGSAGQGSRRGGRNTRNTCTASEATGSC